MMPERRLLVDASPFETRIALLEDGALCEYYVDSPTHTHAKGNVYLGIVRQVRPGMDACFVDIGLERNAYLDFSDMRKTDDAGNTIKPHEGRRVLVQVKREAVGEKGARVTEHVTLPGQYMVLLPHSRHLGLSKRIAEEERAFLREIGKALCPEGMGLILRTAAQRAGEAELAGEAHALEGLWESIRLRAMSAKGACALYEEKSILLSLLRDLSADTLAEIAINDAQLYHFLQRELPALAGALILHPADVDIMELCQVQAEIRRACARRVWLKNGGYLIFDHTEAMHVIDVNTGRFTGKTDVGQTMRAANMEAAQEIARQLRLRDLGGIILVDFIDMQAAGDGEALIVHMREALRPDRAQVKVHGITKLGIMEITRTRLRAHVDDMEPCPSCGGTGMVMTPQAVAHDLYRTWRTMERRAPGRQYRLRISRDVHEAFKAADMIEAMPNVAFETDAGPKGRRFELEPAGD